MFSSSRERAIRICLTAIAASSLLALAGIVIFLFTFKVKVGAVVIKDFFFLLITFWELL